MVSLLVLSKFKQPIKYQEIHAYINRYDIVLGILDPIHYMRIEKGRLMGLDKSVLAINFGFSSALNCLLFAHIMTAEAAECDATNSLSREGAYIGYIEILRLILG